MFYYLEGQITIIDQGLAVVDVGGAGYACYTTQNTLSHLELGKKARLFTYCNVKEDAFDIYGFFDIAERRFFEQLISVSGVGPKAALSILSANTPERLALAIINGDERSLTVAQGIGKRIAQRVILELKDKIAKENAGIAELPGYSSGAPAGSAASKSNDAAAALTVLGYSASEIAAAMRTLDIEGMTVEEIIRSVLKSSLK